MEDDVNTRNKLILVAALIGAIAIPAAAQGAGKVILQDLSVSPAGAAAHKETLELASWSLKTSSLNGNLQITQFVAPASLARLCQSHAVLPAMTLEADGKRHVLRNVVFKECPAAAGRTFSFTFDGETVTPIAASITPAGSQAPDATIAGLTPAKIEARLLSVKIDGNKATVAFMTSKPIGLTTNPGTAAGAPNVSEIVVTKADGTSWSYSGTHALYQDIFIPSAAQGSRVIEMTIEFRSMTGPRSGYVDKDNPIPSRR